MASKKGTAHRAHDRTPKFRPDKRTGNLIVAFYPDPTSKVRQFLSTKTRDLTEAKLFIENHRDRIGSERRGHEVIATREHESYTVGQALDLVVQHYIANEKKNVEGITGLCRKAKLELNTVRAEKLDLQRILDAREAWAKQGKAKATINRYVGAVRQALLLAAELRKISRPPHFKFPFFNEKPFIRKGWVSREELDKVNAAEPWAAQADLNTWAFWTGMRWGEATSLKWEDYEAETHTVTLAGVDAKSGESRVLPLPPGPLRDLIERRLADRHPSCPYIFHHAGHPLTDGERWGYAWRRAGLPIRGVRLRASGKEGRVRPSKLFHDLRRTGVRNLVRALVAAGVGSPERTAMLISGHKTRRIFERYNIVEEHEAGPALAALTQFHARQTPPPAAPPGTLAFTPRRVPSTPAAPTGRIGRRVRRAG